MKYISVNILNTIDLLSVGKGVFQPINGLDLMHVAILNLYKTSRALIGHPQTFMGPTVSLYTTNVIQRNTEGFYVQIQLYNLL